jgi:hypothetical protein
MTTGSAKFFVSVRGPSSQPALKENGMRLSAALVRRTLDQFDARAVPITHPVFPKLSELYGDHTFFLNNNGLAIVEPVDEGQRSGKVIQLASWLDARHTSLTPHNPVPTDTVISLTPEKPGAEADDDPIAEPSDEEPDRAG